MYNQLSYGDGDDGYMTIMMMTMPVTDLKYSHLLDKYITTELYSQPECHILPSIVTVNCFAYHLSV